MRIELSKENPPKFFEDNGSIAFYMKTLIRSDSKEDPIVLNRVRIENPHGGSSEMQLLDESGKELSEPLVIEPGCRKNIYLALKGLDPSSSWLVGKSQRFLYHLTYFFQADKDEVKEITFQFKGTLKGESQTLNEFSKYSFKRTGLSFLFISLFIIFLIFLILNLWVSQNEGVFHQVIPSYLFNLLLSGGLLFLGINFGSLKKAFINLRTTKDFFNTTELYFHNDTLSLLKSRNFTLFSFAGLLFAVIVFGWILFPVKFELDRSSYSAIFLGDGDPKFVSNDKIYWKDFSKVLITPRKDTIEVVEDLERLKIGNLKETLMPLFSPFFSRKVSIMPDSFLLDKSCSACLSEINSDRENLKITYPEIKSLCKTKKYPCMCELESFLNTGAPEASDFSIKGRAIFYKPNTSDWKEEVPVMKLFEIYYKAIEEKGKEQFVAAQIDDLKTTFKVNTSSIINFINRLIKGFEEEYDSVGQTDGKEAAKLDATWAFCAYLSKQGLEYGSDELTICRDLNSILEKNIGVDTVAKSFVRFALLTQSNLIVEKKSIDSLIIDYIDFKPKSALGSGSLKLRNAKIDIVLSQLLEDKNSMDPDFASALVANVKQLEFTGSNHEKKENIGRVINTMFWLKAAEVNNGLSYIRELHDLIVSKAEQEAALPRYYFRNMARSGYAGEKFQLDYFQKYYCAWGGGGAQNEWGSTTPIIYSKEIFEENGKPSQQFIDLASQWDDLLYWKTQCNK
ncbi:MAG: hypothetical protein KDC24_01340 [Saprospiraceae bacterium]|nr:hypothetical protein [Saprospiraceae bacterium]